MATVEQIAAIVEAVLTARGGRADGGGGERGGSKRALDQRNFRRIQTFTGGEAAWKDWAFQFRAALRGADRDMAAILDWVERAPDNIITYDVAAQFVEDQTDESKSAELYDVLCGILAGEGLTILRSLSDMDGFIAWKRLYQRFNPTNPAKALAR